MAKNDTGKTGGTSIGLDDFSQEAIKKAVTSRGLQAPAVLYPSALGLLVFAAMAVAGVSTAMLLAGAAGIGAGAGYLAFQLGFRREKLTRDYLAGLHEALNARRKAMLTDLTTRMRALRFQQGLRQVQSLQEKFDNFAGILDRMLDPEEITYGRYLGIAEQVYLSSLDNLQRVVGALESVQTIDPAQIDKRLRDIHADGIVTTHEAIEEETLNQRKVLRENQLQKIEALLAQNEQAMTQLDMTAVAIAEMRTRNGQATMDMESAMSELQSLAARSANYNRQD